jgi:cytoskeletal protein RodZ
MSFSGLAQFILGFFLGVFILTGTGAAAAYFFLNRFSDAPAKPTYSEEDASESSNGENPSASTPEKASTEATSTSAVESSAPDPPQPESRTIEERFGEQAYEARVTWPSGLSLRDRPSVNASRVGGVYYQDQLVVIGKSSDGDWQQVYIPGSGQQAWVKAGNVEKVN